MVRRGRQAFTLIEILVVIGIILVLIGIAVIGYQHIDKVASEKATMSRFETCKSVLSEYEASVGTINAIESNIGQPAIYSAGNATTLVNPQVAAPGDVNLGGAGLSSPAVPNTAAIFQLIMHVPSAKNTIAAMPANALIPGTSTTGPIIADAWKNPIIYVPSGGMLSVGVTRAGNPVPVNVTVTSFDGRPFWASAGQDGDFSKGDDNLYSTAVIVR